MNNNKTIFVLDDYKKLNKDIHFNCDEEYLNHWLHIGFYQRRLCNKDLLNVTNEFGLEILFHIGYFYYLFTNNLLFDNKISTYKGMESYYYFIPKQQLIFKNEKRYWIDPLKKDKLMLYINRENPRQLNLKYWIAPKYQLVYKNDFFKYDKEIIIVSNKYNIEWGKYPINFITIEYLERIFNLLKDRYTIVYIRPNEFINNKLEYSWDKNYQKEFRDFPIIKEKFNDVIIFDELFNEPRFSNMNYNLLKCYLFSSCTKYISVQGGANNLIAYFAKNIVIFHKEGMEIENNIYDIRSQLQCPENNLKIEYTDDYEIYLKMIINTFL